MEHMNSIRHFFVFVAAVAALAVVAAPYSFNIVCDEPERMRRAGEETEFRIFCTDIGTNSVGGEVEVRLDNFGSTTLVSRRIDPSKENPVILKGSLGSPGFLRAVAINPAISATPFGLGKGNGCDSVGYEAEKLRPGFPRPADFDSYWEGEQMRLNREVPLDVRREP